MQLVLVGVVDVRAHMIVFIISALELDASMLEPTSFSIALDAMSNSNRSRNEGSVARMCQSTNMMRNDIHNFSRIVSEIIMIDMICNTCRNDDLIVDSTEILELLLNKNAIPERNIL